MRYVALSLAMALGLTVTPKAIAHSTKIHYQETAAITINAEYGPNSPIAEAEVLIYAPDQGERPWLQGQTDQAGQFTFAPDRAIPGDWKVMLYDRGHGGEIIIPVTAVATEPTEPTSYPEHVVEHKTTAASIDPALTSTAGLTPLPNVSPVTGSNYPNYSLGQRLLMVISVVWGLTGTALFFHRQAHPKT